MSTTTVNPFAINLESLERHQRQQRMNIRNFLLVATAEELAESHMAATGKGDAFYRDCVLELWGESEWGCNGASIQGQRTVLHSGRTFLTWEIPSQNRFWIDYGPGSPTRVSGWFPIVDSGADHAEFSPAIDGGSLEAFIRAAVSQERSGCYSGSPDHPLAYCGRLDHCQQDELTIAVRLARESAYRRRNGEDNWANYLLQQCEKRCRAARLTRSEIDSLLLLSGKLLYGAGHPNFVAF